MNREDDPPNTSLPGGGEATSTPAGSAATARPTSSVIVSVTEEARERAQERGRTAGFKLRRRSRITRTSLRTSQDLDRDNKEFELLLKQRVANFALAAVVGELIVANAVFVLYAWWGREWDVPTGAIQVWLAATVVQVVGILYIIASYLFPKRGSVLSVNETDHRDD